MFCAHTFILSKKLCCHFVYITLKNVIKYELNIFFKLVVFALFLPNLWDDYHHDSVLRTYVWNYTEIFTYYQGKV